jgi:hypothetical protein
MPQADITRTGEQKKDRHEGPKSSFVRFGPLADMTACPRDFRLSLSTHRAPLTSAITRQAQSIGVPELSHAITSQ